MDFDHAPLEGLVNGILRYSIGNIGLDGADQKQEKLMGIVLDSLSVHLIQLTEFLHIFPVIRLYNILCSLINNYKTL